MSVERAGWVDPAAGRRVALAIVALSLAGCGITEPPGPETLTQVLSESVELTADRPIAIVPVTVRFTPATEGVAGEGRSQYGLVELTDPESSHVGGATVTAISTSDQSQPRAWLLGPYIPLPEVSLGGLGFAGLCTAPATCEHAYRLVITRDEAGTLEWKVRAGMSFAAGSDLRQTRIDIERTGDVELLAVPPTVDDVVRGTLTLDASGPQDRAVRLRYTGPTPNGWPLRVEGIVRTHRTDGERLPLSQLDIAANVGPGGGGRLFSDYVGPDLTVLANSFDGCAAAVPCERFLVLHFYPVPDPIEIDWEVEIRVRDYGSDSAVDATLGVDELTPDEAAAIAAQPCATEAIIDLAARQGIIDDTEEARQLGLLAANGWTSDELGGVAVVRQLCATLDPKR